MRRAISLTRPHKYGAKRTVVDGITFASKKEAARYQELRLLEKAGEVTELQLQPTFAISVPAPYRSNVSIPVAVYVADFRYRLGGLLIIEDVKGVKTPVYRLKKKLVEAQYGITINEL